MSARRPVVLCILDGWGLRAERTGNGPVLAKTPVFDRLMAECPNSTLTAHGPAVGLPEGSIGNSEVGHLHIGAGRTILMEMQRINRAVETGEFHSDPALEAFSAAIGRSGGSAHVAGIISDVGVHGLASHIVHAARAISESGSRVWIHALTDGRDSPPGKAAEFVESLRRALPGGARIATVGGRYFAMDRDRRWSRVETAWKAVMLGRGERSQTALDAVAMADSKGKTDEFIPPTVVGDYSGVEDGDGFFIANFRADRARQISAAIGDPEFDAFDISNRPKLAAMLGLVNYFETPKSWIASMFEKPEISDTLGEWVARHGRTQFRLAETEKYPHVTFFLNGGKEKREPGEQRYMAQSPKVATYDLAPEMAAEEVADKLAEAIRKKFDLVVVNFANPDMVGHTGNLPAVIKACEAVDQGLGQAVSALAETGGAMIVTADHGNCEQMFGADSEHPHTAHTTNPVPAILVGSDEGLTVRSGELSDIAPTLLDLMGLEKAPAMTGESLLLRGQV